VDHPVQQAVTINKLDLRKSYISAVTAWQCESLTSFPCNIAHFG